MAEDNGHKKAPRLTSVAIGCQIDPHVPDAVALRLKRGDCRDHFEENPCAKIDWGIPF